MIEILHGAHDKGMWKMISCDGPYGIMHDTPKIFSPGMSDDELEQHMYYAYNWDVIEDKHYCTECVNYDRIPK